MFPSLILVKTGWSPTYSGETVTGDHAYLGQTGAGHEAFNFRRDRDGNFKGYFPNPNQADYSPTPLSDWLVVFLSKPPRGRGLRVVGWYESATFHPQHFARLDRARAANGSLIDYAISASKAVLVPETERITPIDGTHFRRTPVVHMEGIGRREPWRLELREAIETELLALGYSTDAKLRATPVGYQGYSGDPEHRRKIEKAAMAYVIDHFEKKKWKHEDVSQYDYGWDLEFTKGDERLLVEVKGRGPDTDLVIISANEYNQHSRSNWRIAIVSNLNNGKAKLTVLTGAELDDIFELTPTQFRAVRRV